MRLKRSETNVRARTTKTHLQSFWSVLCNYYINVIDKQVYDYKARFITTAVGKIRAYLELATTTHYVNDGK